MRIAVTALMAAAGLAIAGGIPALAADDSKTAAADAAFAGAPARPQITDDGPVLVTPTGATLYTYGPDDSSPGKSTCSNVPVRDMKDPTSGFGKYPLPGHTFQRSCAEVWHPYLAEAGALPPGGEWSVIARPEGGKQWTYRGRPLYTSVRDLKPGDHNGGPVGDYGNRGWRLASPPLGDFPPGVQLTRDAETLVIAANGRPLFTPRGKQAACHGCEELFAPLSAPAITNPGGDWSTVDAGAGRLQYAYKGKPLFVAPDSLSNREIARAGTWEEVVFRKLAGTPPEIRTHFTATGEVYTDKGGKTLYLFTCTAPGCDDPGGPAAYWTALCGDAKECARRWRPYPAAANARGVGEWSVVEATDPIFTEPTGGIYPKDAPHVKVWAYHGKPVYTYFEDKAPGDIWGNQLRWFGLSTFNAVQVPGRSLYR